MLGPDLLKSIGLDPSGVSFVRVHFVLSTFVSRGTLVEKNNEQRMGFAT
jgi:hypothetical protein